jgi:DNA-binding transcriptional MerR regulator
VGIKGPWLNPDACVRVRLTPTDRSLLAMNSRVRHLAGLPGRLPRGRNRRGICVASGRGSGQGDGKTVRAIHLYEELGLLKASERSKGRYRLFTEEALVRVRWITKLQSLGLSLSEIQQLVKDRRLRRRRTLQRTVCAASTRRSWKRRGRSSRSCELSRGARGEPRVSVGLRHRVLGVDAGALVPDL